MRIAQHLVVLYALLAAVVLYALPAVAGASAAGDAPPPTRRKRTPVPKFINTRDEDVRADLLRWRTTRCPTASKYPSYHEIVATGHALAHDPTRAVESRRCFLDAMDLYLTRLGLYGQTPEEVALSASPDAAQAINYAQQVLRNSPQYSSLPAGVGRDPRLTDATLRGGGAPLVSDVEAGRAGVIPPGRAAAANANAANAAANAAIVSPSPFVPSDDEQDTGPRRVDRDSADDPDDPDDAPPFVPPYAAGAEADADAAAAAAAAAAAVTGAKANDGAVADRGADSAYARNGVNDATDGVKSGGESSSGDDSGSNRARLPSSAFLPTAPAAELTYNSLPYIPRLSDFGLEEPAVRQPYARITITDDDADDGAQGTWTGADAAAGQSDGAAAVAEGGSGAAAAGAGARAAKAGMVGGASGAKKAPAQHWRAHTPTEWMETPKLRSRARAVYDLQLQIQQRALGRP